MEDWIKEVDDNGTWMRNSNTRLLIEPSEVWLKKYHPWFKIDVSDSLIQITALWSEELVIEVFVNDISYGTVTTENGYAEVLITGDRGIYRVRLVPDKGCDREVIVIV